VLSLALPGRVFVCVTPTDMRKSFDGLAAVVRDHLQQDPLAGDLFVCKRPVKDILAKATQFLLARRFSCVGGGVDKRTDQADWSYDERRWAAAQTSGNSSVMRSEG
jgi:hypothetical protein